MAFLYYAMYGHMNCQLQIGSGTNFYTKSTGQTDILGMTDTKASIQGNIQSINFWGLENWWGNKYEWIEGIETKSLEATIQRPDGTTDTVPFIAMTNYNITKTKIGPWLDLIPTKQNDSTLYSNGYCDYAYWINSSNLGVVRRSTARIRARVTGLGWLLVASCGKRQAWERSSIYNIKRRKSTSTGPVCGSAV